MSFVKIIAYDDETVIKQLKAESQRSAERIEAGLNINLDHNKYFTIIEEGDHNGN